MKAVAISPALDQAVAQLSSEAARLLQQVHEGAVADARASAERQLRTLREFVRCTGVDLSELPSWNANITNWRAIARLASAAGVTAQAG